MIPLLLVASGVLQHLGPLHAHEKMLTYVLAFGPLVLLGFVIWLRGRQDAVHDDSESA